VEGHPAQRQVDLALEELRFFSTSMRILGVYPADPFRRA
jgi:prephenate dehydratase